MTGMAVTRRTLLASTFAVAALTGGHVRATARTAQAYRGIRYASAERFGPAEVEPFREKLIRSERGPLPPQLPSRLAISMGAQAPLRQDEHCQVLSVFTPSRSGRRPVIVFIHGGAFVTGGGELPWYDGLRLATEQDVVVVPITYRLGALGCWLPDDSKKPSPALSDQIAALQWINDNIDRFGGDPTNVTIIGQSAGAASAMSLTDWGYGQKLFRRIVAMSGYRTRGDRSQLEKLSRMFDAALGDDPHTASVDKILQAQRNLPPPPSNGEPTWQIAAPEQPAAFNVDAVAGWTREDLAAHVLLAQQAKPTPGADLRPMREATKPLATRTQRFATEVAKTGRTAYLYSFDWNGPDTGLGNCHCIDLSFLFGDRAAWDAAPMLAGVNWDDHDRIGRAMRAQWAAFARTGDPNDARHARWVPVSEAATPVTSLF